MGYSPWGPKESDTTERLSTHLDDLSPNVYFSFTKSEGESYNLVFEIPPNILQQSCDSLGRAWLSVEKDITLPLWFSVTRKAVSLYLPSIIQYFKLFTLISNPYRLSVIT